MKYYLKEKFYSLFFKSYFLLFNYIRGWIVRHKSKIKVVFVITETAMWKTESLYNLMKEHPRFIPILIPSPNISNPNAEEDVIKYFKKKGYDFVILEKNKKISCLNPDITFYQQPYFGTVPSNYFIGSNLGSLFCHVNYCFRNLLIPQTVNELYCNICWQIYVENNVCLKENALLMSNHGLNQYATGIPIMDELIDNVRPQNDPWKKQLCDKKRIIYAPHHSILNRDIAGMGTFKLYGLGILNFAKKYQNEVQWVFKPHPFLETKLRKIYGNAWVDDYYNSWNELPNTQVELGNYIDIFKTSDALIHDCGSFIIEYIYMHKPALYLNDPQNTKKARLNQMTLDCKDLHVQAYQLDDVEMFIKDVIKGKDLMRDAREAYYKSNLLPPLGLSTSENIINSILG